MRGAYEQRLVLDNFEHIEGEKLRSTMGLLKGGTIKGSCSGQDEIVQVKCLSTRNRSVEKREM